MRSIQGTGSSMNPVDRGSISLSSADLEWEKDNGCLTANGRFGFYRIFRTMGNWILLFMYQEKDPLPYYKITNSLESSIKNANLMEREVFFHKLMQKALEKDNGPGPPGNVKS